MKITLTTSQVADELRKDSNAGWSYAGANALAEYLDENAGEETEFDCVAIRCDFSEYSSAQDAAEAYGWEADSHIEEDGSECDADALQWLQDRTQVIEFSGGVIVANF